MTVIVIDVGFCADEWVHGYVKMDELFSSRNCNLAVDVPSGAQPELLRPFLSRIDLIRIDFPIFADGRGFTIARRLRLMKYQGRLRAKGHIIADQYTMLRRSGFDEVEIDAALAKRQPEGQWLARSNWREHDYQSKLRSRKLNIAV